MSLTAFTRLTAISAAVVLALGVHGGVAAAQSPCADAEGVGYVCGINNPEDLVRVDGSPYVLTGNMGNQDRERGGFYSVDVRTRDVRDVRPDFSAPAVKEYGGCPGPPDAELFSSHGIELSSERVGEEEGLERTVYAVNHGGRESIEVFRLEAGSGGLRLAWIGCVLLPRAYQANSVTALPNGGFVTTVPVRGEEELLAAGLGRPTGVVLRWSAVDGWREVSGVEASFPNGILVSPDGGWLYIAAYTERAVARVSLGRDPVVSSKVAVPFNPDNLRWAPGGGLLATGQDAQPALVELTCVRSSVETCEVPTGVAMIDPMTFQATSLYRRPGDERFGAGTSSIVAGEELWIGSFRAQRLLRVPLRALSAGVAADPLRAAANVRLTRRCVRNGGLRVALAGEVERVRDVSFTVGRRLVARDAAVPFRRVIPRRVVAGSNARWLRAVAHIADGQPLRVVLRRSLPRCRDRYAPRRR